MRDGFCQAPEQASLTIMASTPVVPVAERQKGRNFLTLPALQYEFDVSARCAAGLQPDGMSLSVADTRKSITRSDILVDSATSTLLDVPAAQIGPVAVADFCTVPDDNATTAHEPEILEILSVLSAQFSLLCSSETGKQMTYVSKSLDVTLQCDRQEAAAAEAE